MTNPSSCTFCNITNIAYFHPPRLYYFNVVCPSPVTFRYNNEYFCNNCVDSHCLSCSSPNVCVYCSFSYYVNAGKGCSYSSQLSRCMLPVNSITCLYCQYEYYYNTTNSVCAACPTNTNCTQCLNSTACFSCKNGFYLNSTDQQCYTCSVMANCNKC